MKKFFAGVLTLALTVLGVLCGCGDNSSSPKSKEKKLEANDASDFKWHEITAADDQAPENIGCIMITKYIGDRTDIVVPKIIADKPVVSIGDYAFCPYTEKDLRYDSEYDDGSEFSPERKLFELSTGKDLEYFFDNLSEEQEEELNQYKNYKMFDTIENLNDIPSLSDITRIMLPDTIEYIGKFAFGFCNNLETIEIYCTDNEEIPSVSFYYTPFFANIKLKSFNFYLDSYGNNGCFEYCPSLEDVYIHPDSSGHVDLNCLKYSENVNSVHIADGTTSLSGITENKWCTFNTAVQRYDYFYDYSSTIFKTNISEIYLPSSLSEVSNHTFCTYIKTDIIMNSKKLYSDIDEIECSDHASVIIVAPEGSYAESYANESGISCVNYKDEITKEMKEEQESAYKKQHEDALALRNEIIADYEAQVYK